MDKTTIDRRWLPLNALRAFEGVAKHSSFTAAANALLISQSALSRHVIALEKLIGAQLFERRPHALVLTKAGQHLLPAVHEVLRPPGIRARRYPQRERAPALRTLRVQMPPSFAAHLAVPILRDFRRSRRRGGDRSGESLRRRPAARRCRRGGGVLEAHGDGPGEGPVVAGALERAVPSEHRRALRGQEPGRVHRGQRTRARAPLRSAAPPLVVAIRAPGGPRVR